MEKKRKNKKQTYFDVQWLKDSLYSDWLKAGSVNTTFRCKVCPNKKGNSEERTLGDMGIGALKKHAGGDGHKNNMKQYLSTLHFFQPKQKQVMSNDTTVAPEEENQEEVVDLGTAPGNEESNSKVNPNPIPSIFSVQASMKTEMICALNCVYHGYSDRSMKDFGNTLRAMCPTSTEAQQYEMGTTKLRYIVNHGLYPYYKEQLNAEIQASPYITAMFDESMNDVAQKSEMDIHMRYWNDTAKRVKVRFYDARFLGHTTHQDLLKNFNDICERVDMSKLLQVSMDGPNTNILFLEVLQKERTNDGLTGVIDIGSCNLHTVHGALETGTKASGWLLKKLMKGCFYLLHDTAARREDYYKLTGSQQYPYRFIVTRWVEDGKVADRLISLWPNMLKMFEFWEGLTKSKRPKSNSYSNVLVNIADKLIVVKLHFFSYVAGILKPYLTCYQGEGPMVPFMNYDIQKFYRSLLGIVVKPTVLSKCKNGLDLMKLDLDEEDNILAPKKIHLGFAAEDVILRLGGDVEAAQVKTLREGARTFVVATCNKLAIRNPLSYVIVRNSIVFTPKSILELTKEDLSVKMKRLITKLVHIKKLSSKTADDARIQYQCFLDEVVVHKEKFLKYDRKSKRLDEFFFDDMKVEDNHPQLAVVMKIIFTLSHGQASVERGFNDNNVVLKDNQKENTIIARRFIKNYMSQQKLLPHTVPITQALVKSCRKAHQRYIQHLDEEKQKREKVEKSQEVQTVENEIKALEEESVNLQSTIEEMKSEFLNLMFKAEERNNILMVVQGNALKRKSVEKEGYLGDLKKRIVELEEKRKTMK